MRPKFTLSAELHDILTDEDAIETCKELLNCYNSDESVKLSQRNRITQASPLYIATATNRGLGLQTVLENINHAHLIVVSSAHKAILKHTDDIIEILKKCDALNRKISQLKVLSGDAKCALDGKCNQFLCRYHKLESHAQFLSRAAEVLFLSNALKIAARLLLEARADWNIIRDRDKSTPVNISSFALLAGVACRITQVQTLLSNVESNSVSQEMSRNASNVTNEIVEFVLKFGIWPIFECKDPELYMNTSGGVLAASHWILAVLGIHSLAMLQIVDDLVRETSECINLKQCASSLGSSSASWQPIFISQLSEYMALYSRNIKRLHLVSGASNVQNINFTAVFGDAVDAQMRGASIKIRSDFEIHSACDAYARRCIALLGGAITHLRSQKNKLDVAALAPMLITLGENMHVDLQGIYLTVDVNTLYFKGVCEDLAKEFLVDAASKIVPATKAAVSCMALPTSDAGSLEQWALLALESFPAYIPLDTMVEYLQKSANCSLLLKRVREIVVTCVAMLLERVKQMATETGTRLHLTDGKNKIVLKPPSDTQKLNAKLHGVLNLVVSKLQIFVTVDPDPLSNTLQLAADIVTIQPWMQDLIEVLWHTASYIGADDNWGIQHLATACQHMQRILTVVKQLYIDPCITFGSKEILQTLADEIISILVLYSLVIWPLDETTQMQLVHVITETEVAISENISVDITDASANALAAIRKLVVLCDQELVHLIAQGLHRQQLQVDDALLALHTTVRMLKSHEPQNMQMYQFFDIESLHCMLYKIRRQQIPPQRMLLYLKHLGIADPVETLDIYHADGT